MNKFKNLLLATLSLLSLALSTAVHAESQETDIKKVLVNFAEGLGLIKSGVLEIVSTVADIVHHRIPKGGDLTYQIALGSMIEMASKKLGFSVTHNNVAAKEIFWDIANAPSEDVSKLAKPFVKAGAIFVLQRNGHDADRASALSNYPGDFAAQALRKDNSLALPLIEALKTFIKNQISDISEHFLVGDKVAFAVHHVGDSIATVFVSRGYGASARANAAGQIVTAYLVTTCVHFVSFLISTIPSQIVFDTVDWASGPLKEQILLFSISAASEKHEL